MNYKKAKEIRKYIAKKAGNGTEYYDIWIDFPETSKFSEASQFRVKTSKEYIPFSVIFPIDNWLDGYNENRYRGHLFCPLEIREKVYKIFVEYIRESYKLDFESFALDLCKWEPESLIKQ